jgi:hypothetical protein
MRRLCYLGSRLTVDVRTAVVRREIGASMQESPSEVAGHLIVYHWPAVRSVLLVLAIGAMLLVARVRRRRR